MTLVAVGISLTMSLFDFEVRHSSLVHATIITGAVLDNVVAVSLSYYLYSMSRDCMTRYVTTWLLVSLSLSSPQNPVACTPPHFVLDW
jgi:hypothetical protein